VLFERDEVLAALRELADDAAAGAGRLVFVGGEAGVGKTMLAGALTADAPDGTVVRRGACDSLSTAEALGPLLDAAPEITDALGARVDAFASPAVPAHPGSPVPVADTAGVGRRALGRRGNPLICCVSSADASTGGR
jgi:hypothetical protein